MGPVFKAVRQKGPERGAKDIAKIFCEEMGIQAGTYGAVVALENMSNTLLPERSCANLECRRQSP
jgi:hypothetical protein